MEPWYENTLLVGITGYMGSGKSLFAQLLENELREHTRWEPSLHGFADPLKAWAKKYFRWDGCKGTSDVLIDGARYIGGRQLLQGLGVAMRNEVDPNFWLSQLNERLAVHVALQSAPQALLLHDLRFINEAEWLKSYNGVLIRVTRPGRVSDGHESEKYIHTEAMTKLVDIEIRNDATVEQLRHQARRLDMISFNRA
jgi:hypothetical protein